MCSHEKVLKEILHIIKSELNLKKKKFMKIRSILKILNDYEN
jgi:hypothetical protein